MRSDGRCLWQQLPILRCRADLVVPPLVNIKKRENVNWYDNVPVELGYKGVYIRVYIYTHNLLYNIINMWSLPHPVVFSLSLWHLYIYMHLSGWELPVGPWKEPRKNTWLSLKTAVSDHFPTTQWPYWIGPIPPLLDNYHRGYSIHIYTYTYL